MIHFKMRIVVEILSTFVVLCFKMAAGLYQQFFIRRMMSLMVYSELRGHLDRTALLD